MFPQIHEYIRPKHISFADLDLENLEACQAQLNHATDFLSDLETVYNHIDGTAFEAEPIVDYIKTLASSPKTTLHVYRWIMTMAISNGMPSDPALHKVERLIAELAEHKMQLDDCIIIQRVDNGLNFEKNEVRPLFERALVELENGQFKAYSELKALADHNSYCNQQEALLSNYSEPAQWFLNHTPLPNQREVPTPLTLESSLLSSHSSNMALAALLIVTISSAFLGSKSQKPQKNKTNKASQTTKTTSVPKQRTAVKDEVAESLPPLKKPVYGRAKSKQRKAMLKRTNAYGQGFFVSKHNRKRMADEAKRQAMDLSRR